MNKWPDVTGKTRELAKPWNSVSESTKWETLSLSWSLGLGSKPTCSQGKKVMEHDLDSQAREATGWAFFLDVCVNFPIATVALWLKVMNLLFK